MKEMIKLLLSLQERDLELDRVRAEVAAIPAKVAGLKADIQNAKKALEDAKKEMIILQLAKKQMELDLDAQESAVRKHSNELNSVKTNEAYKALLGEIEKAKKDKSLIEDKILENMEATDQATTLWKEKEAGSKEYEAGILKQIADWENKQKDLEQGIAAKEADRVQTVGTLSKDLAARYAQLRSGKRTGAAVVPIRNEQCSGCHMKISQNVINEVRRGQKLMTCESCSRIVYLEEVPAA